MAKFQGSKMCIQVMCRDGQSCPQWSTLSLVVEEKKNVVDVIVKHYFRIFTWVQNQEILEI